MQFAGLSLSRIIKKSAVRKLKAVGHLMFNKYLLVTNVGISITLSGVGDTIEQHYEILQGDHDKWDKLRTRNMAITGMTVGLLTHHSYKCLDYFFPGRAVKTVVKKLIIDQVIMSPLCIGLFFTTLAIIEQSSFEEFSEEVIYKGWRLFTAELIIWPPCQLFNFFFLPPRFRVLYDNTISVGFDIYSSRVKHDKPRESKESEITSKQQ